MLQMQRHKNTPSPSRAAALSLKPTSVLAHLDVYLIQFSAYSQNGAKETAVDVKMNALHCII